MLLHARSRSLAATLVVALATTSGLAFPNGSPLAVSAALADDGDGGGDDGGDGGGGGGGGGSGSGPGGRDSYRDWSGSNRGRSLLDIFRGWDRPRPQRKAARRAQPVEQYEARQLVAVGLEPAAITGLEAEGFAISERAPVALVGGELVKLRIPNGLTLAAARARVADASPGAVVDFNHFYRPDQANVEPCGKEQCLARHVVDWPVGAPGACTAPTRIGLIDTAINDGHLAFAGGKIETVRLGSGDLPDSGRQHGTAVAALLVGSATSRAPGLLPGSELIAVDAFHRGGGADRSSAYDLVRALDLLAGRDVEVINMSLTGPANLLLERTVEKATERNIVLVAAAGNDGPHAAPLYPGAYEEVIAVTAVDRRKNPYRRAGTGAHIDIAAPGVQVWTAASVKGAQPKTGTSFAAPFVTASVAMMKAERPELKPAEIAERLRGTAEDLGKPGKDPVFGWGLLNPRAICGS